MANEPVNGVDGTIRDALRELLADPWAAVIALGLGWMMIGMLVMPSGVSYNPGKAYQASLIVLLYIPALWLTLRRRAQVWRQLWPLPAFRVFLLLLAWATLSLAWAQLHRPGDEFARVLSVALFVLGWHGFASRHSSRAYALLAVAGWGMAACALVYSVVFLVFLRRDDARIVGEGVIATANAGAAAMGAACVWLSQLPSRRSWHRWASAVGFVCLLAFIALTRTRGVWLALGTCAVLAPLWRRDRLAKLLSGAVIACVLVAVAWPWSMLVNRGWSLRPQIFMQAMQMIEQRPWLGLGQGAPFVMRVGGQALTHSHNLLTQTAIELGLPGLLLLVVLWLSMGWAGWRHRSDVAGRIVLALWIYASVVLQFDLPQLLDSPRPGWLLIWLPFALSVGLPALAQRGGAAGMAPRPTRL